MSTLAVPGLHAADWIAMSALYRVAGDVRFARFKTQPVIVFVEIEPFEDGESENAYVQRVIAPATEALLSKVPDEITQFVELRLPHAAQVATNSRVGGLSLQYRADFSLQRGVMVHTLMVAYIPV